MTMKARWMSVPGLALALTVAGCDATPDSFNDQELVTRVQITLVNTQNPTDTATITAIDADGDGADIEYLPSALSLRRGATYTGSITIDDTINDEALTDEIKAEADEHLFRYALTPGGSGTVTLTDRESDYQPGGRDLPVGLTFEVTVSGAATGTGTLQTLLYHFDDAPKTSGTSTSDELDIDLAVPVTFVAPSLDGASGR